MQYPISTGQVARLLGTTEPHLAECVRRGRVSPRPPVLAGRRLWSPKHVAQVAAALGLRLPAGAQGDIDGASGSVDGPTTADSHSISHSAEERQGGRS